MKIDKNLFEYLTAKSPEILDKFSQFIAQIQIEDKTEYVDFLGNTRVFYKITNNYYSNYFKSETPGIRIDHVKQGDVGSFVVFVSGDIVTEKEVETKSFFGKISKSKEKSFDHLSLDCYPFVNEKESIYGFQYHPAIKNEAYLDFDEFISKISETIDISNIDMEIIQGIQNFVNNIITYYSQNLIELSISLEDEISTIDKNGDGKADIVDASDLMRLLNKNQSKIIEIDKDFIHKFIRISNYLKQRSQNIQSIFSSLKNEKSITNREELIGILKNQIHNYELLMFHSINMVVSISTDNLMAFYEIYETFDKLNVFNSNWENEVSEKLTNIGDKLDDLMYSIYNMEQNIVSELSNLNYVTQSSFEDLNRSVTSQLKEVESSINSIILPSFRTTD